MKKRTLTIMTGGVITLAMLAGCGSGNAAVSADNQAGGASQGQKTKIVYTTWNENQKESIQKTVEGFNKVYPDIEVEIQTTPWDEYWTKMEAAATSGNMADVVTMHTNQIEKYVKADVLMDLTNLNETDENFSYANYNEGITNLYVFDGKHYAVPKDKDCIVLLYNKQLFDDAGVAYPTADWSWEDIKINAEKLTDKDNGIYGFNAYNNEQEGWGSFIYQNGGDFIDDATNQSMMDQPAAIQAMEFYMELNRNYSPSKEMQAEVDYITMFGTGKVAMQTIGNWQLNYYIDNELVRDTFAISPLPKGPAGNATISNGISLAIPKSSKNAEAAKTFVAYASSEQGMKDAAGGPAIPVYQGVDQVWAQQHQDLYDTQVILDSLQYGVQLRGSELKTQWFSALSDQIGKIFDGTAEVEPALKEASVQMNEILAKENK